MFDPVIVRQTNPVAQGIPVAWVGLIFICALMINKAQAGQDGGADVRPERMGIQISGEKPQTVMRVPLPPAAVITRTEDGSNAWRQLGYVSVNFAAIEQSFYVRLYDAGWLSVMRVPVRSTSPRNEISIWQRGDVRIMLMLWEEDVDRTGFSWGVDSGDLDNVRFLTK